MPDSPCRTCKGGKLTHNLCKMKCKRYTEFKNEMKKIKIASNEIWWHRKIGGKW